MFVFLILIAAEFNVLLSFHRYVGIERVSINSLFKIQSVPKRYETFPC